MTYTSTHKDYDKHIQTWIKLDDVCDGQEAIKAKRTTYLKEREALKRDSNSSNKATSTRYDEYLERAMFPGVTAITLGKNIGLAFSKVPTFNRPDELEYLEINADGSGRSIYQVAQRATRLVNKHYRCGIFVDFPAVAPSRNREEDLRKNAYPMIHIINAKAILDWRHIVVGNQRKISFVKIQEYIEEVSIDGLTTVSKLQYRFLLLEPNKDGANFVYTTIIAKQDDKGNWVEGEKQIPKDRNGDTWDYIPFTFCGAVDNSDDIDTAPLYEIAEVELAYYRNSADVEESGFVVGQPTLSVDVTAEQYEIIKKEGLALGSRRAFPGKAAIVQASENNLSRQLSLDKWAQMKELGARLIEAGSANKTATQADNDNSVQHSVMSLVVSNVSEALTMALRWCARFTMANYDLPVDKLAFTIAQDFNKPRYDPNRSRLIYEAAISGKIPMKLWYQYEQTGTFPEDKWDDVLFMLEKEKESSPALPTD